MAIGESIQRYPLLRLVVSYVAGIALADALHGRCGSLSWLSMGICVLSLLVMIGIHLAGKALGRIAYGVASVVLFVMLGVTSYSVKRDMMQYPWPADERTYEAKVLELPRERAHSLLLAVEVHALRDSSEWVSVNRKVLAYMEPTAAADSLLPGDVICFRSTIRSPRNFTEDLSFDYARYVTMQGASGTVFLPHGGWGKVRDTRLSLRERMKRLCHHLQVHYMHTVFSDEVLGVLKALTLGDKRMLSDEVRAIYADAGVAHVLAMSGLHVGVIYAMLSFIMQGLIRRRSIRWLRELIIIGVLWLFAMLVGMSSSIVRAVSMYTLYVLARWISRDSSSIHVLSLAALVMLLIEPLYLFDISFQLSFIAMASIIAIEPPLERLVAKNALPRIPAYFVSIICMSLAAQIGTFPLSLYHFGTFPAYFLLTNLLVVPIISLLLPLTFFWWVLMLGGIPMSMHLGQFLEMLTRWLNICLMHIAQWPGAVLHVLDFNLASVLFVYLLILFLALFIVKKWPRALVYAMIALLGLSVSYLFV